MRTLSTQVRLRRLVRAFAEAIDRIASEPLERRRAASVVARLQELTEQVHEAWDHETSISAPGDALGRYVSESLRAMDLAILGLQQAGGNLELLKADFEAAALPLEVFLRGLDLEPVLQRSA